METTTPAPESRHNARIVRPRVDIIEQADEVLIYADMPGVSADNLEITLERKVLTLHGKVATDQTLYQRAFTLSGEIDRDGINATIRNGVLTLVLPKSAEKPETVQRIAVNPA
jgi:HSP20 family molecular chaperone IbpA